MARMTEEDVAKRTWKMEVSGDRNNKWRYVVQKEMKEEGIQRDKKHIASTLNNA